MSALARVSCYLLPILPVRKGSGWRVSGGDHYGKESSDDGSGAAICVLGRVSTEDRQDCESSRGWQLARAKP
jgi:hypothetical protein